MTLYKLYIFIVQNSNVDVLVFKICFCMWCSFEILVVAYTFHNTMSCPNRSDSTVSVVKNRNKHWYLLSLPFEHGSELLKV